MEKKVWKFFLEDAKCFINQCPLLLKFPCLKTLWRNFLVVGRYFLFFTCYFFLDIRYFSLLPCYLCLLLVTFCLSIANFCSWFAYVGSMPYYFSSFLLTFYFWFCKFQRGVVALCHYQWQKYDNNISFSSDTLHSLD